MPYELEERTFRFSRDIIDFVKQDVAKTISNTVVISQLIRSATSVGANYIEANESLGKKDFFMHIKISLKEAKESAYWLRLIDVNSSIGESTRKRLYDEAMQFLKIFGSISEKQI